MPFFMTFLLLLLLLLLANSYEGILTNKGDPLSLPGVKLIEVLDKAGAVV